MIDAIAKRVLSDVQQLQTHGGVSLDDLLDDAVFEGVTQALSKESQELVTAALEAEWPSRAGYRSGTRPFSIGSPVGMAADAELGVLAWLAPSLQATYST